METNSFEYRGYLIKKARGGFDVYDQNEFITHVDNPDIDTLKFRIDFAISMKLLNSNLTKLHVDYTW